MFTSYQKLSIVGDMTPFAHQEAAVEKTWSLPGFAYFWEPRVGKSIPQVLTALRLYAAGMIDGVIILAPQGVHHAWARDVIPMCLEDEPSTVPGAIVDWLSSQAHSVKFTKRVEEALKTPGLLWVCADSNGLTSGRLREYLEDVVKARKCLLVLDESHFFKNPKADRTKFVMTILSKKCPFRRILSGTPLTSPFDLWSQFQIVDPTIFNERWVPFKTRYGIFEVKFFGPRAVKVVSGYKELPDLKAKIEPHCSWLTLHDVFPNLPATLPTERVFFDLAPGQRKMYNELKKEYILQLENGEVAVTSPLVMMLRLSQIARSFVTTDNGIQPIPGENPALDALIHEIAKYPTEKIVVWARFTQDVNLILARLAEVGLKAVRLDGQVSEEQRLTNRDLFQTDRSVQAIVGTPSTGGVGVDLSAGSVMIFYSHGFQLIERLQAMSRVLGINQTKSIHRIDIVGRNTVDVRCMSLLEARVDVVGKIQDRSALLNALKGDDSDWAPSEIAVAVEESIHGHLEEPVSEHESEDLMEQMIKNKEK